MELGSRPLHGDRCRARRLLRQHPARQFDRLRAKARGGGSVLGSIKPWLNAPVEEWDGNGKIQRRRNTRGTPQAGVIPFGEHPPALVRCVLGHGRFGPLVQSLMVHYADSFVILERYLGEDLRRFVDEKIQGWLGSGPPWNFASASWLCLSDWDVQRQKAPPPAIQELSA